MAKNGKPLISAVLPNVSEIRYKNLRVLILDRPTDPNMDVVIRELKKYNCNTLVRVCEASYSDTKLKEADIKTFDWEFQDGSGPPANVVSGWLNLMREHYTNAGAGDAEVSPCIAIHCVAGLGRAPVMVGLALLERGATYEDCVELIRKQRPHALNVNQLRWLENYHAGGKLKPGRGCTIL